MARGLLALVVVGIALLAWQVQAQPSPMSSAQSRPTSANELTVIAQLPTATPIASYLPVVMRAANTPIPPTATRVPEQCAAEYPTVCIPPPPPDLNCGDIPYRNFIVLPPDRHQFDSDRDFIGCETA